MTEQSMGRTRGLWQIMNVGLLFLYAAAGVLLYGGAELMHPFLLFIGFILFTHVMEIPVAFMLLAEQKPAPLRLIIGTVLFGFTWWLPARWGVYATE